MGKREGRKMELSKEIARKPFQGVWNIIRFNWHFYVVAGGLLIALLFFKNIFPPSLEIWLLIGVGLAVLTMVVSLVASYYIYDYSNLYQLGWLENKKEIVRLNINAGFDEISQLIKNKYPNSKLKICDFYDPKKHTEISIKRARKAYPPHPETISVDTQTLPFQNHQFDQVLAILSAHEIRDEAERIQFFRALQRVTHPSGTIYVMEHLRDVNNFLAYTIGFLHFYSKKTWLRTFSGAGLVIKEEIKITPFITLFILKSHGVTS